MSDHDHDPDAIWVTSDRAANNRYVATVHPTPDVSIPLDHLKAVAYATTVIRTVAYAEYDAAVIRQLQPTLAAGSRKEAARMVMMLRDRRKIIDPAPTAPLIFTGGVSAFTGEPFVHVHLHRNAITQWTPDEARSHAMYVLDAAIVARLDQGYLAFLCDAIKLDQDVAIVAVDDLRRHRVEGAT